MENEHVHHFVPRPTGKRINCTDWVEGKPRRYTEPEMLIQCECGAQPESEKHVTPNKKENNRGN